MKLLFCFVLSFLLVGCNGDKLQSPEVEYEIKRHCATERDRQALSKFVVDCATAANPKSDEEGEDLVSQCQYTGIDVVCPEHRHKVTTIKRNNGMPASERIDEVDNDGNVINENNQSPTD